MSLNTLLYIIRAAAKVTHFLTSLTPFTRLDDDGMLRSVKRACCLNVVVSFANLPLNSCLDSDSKLDRNQVIH